MPASFIEQEFHIAVSNVAQKQVEILACLPPAIALPFKGFVAFMESGSKAETDAAAAKAARAAALAAAPDSKRKADARYRMETEAEKKARKFADQKEAQVRETSAQLMKLLARPDIQSLDNVPSLYAELIALIDIQKKAEQKREEEVLQNRLSGERAAEELKKKREQEAEKKRLEEADKPTPAGDEPKKADVLDTLGMLKDFVTRPLAHLTGQLVDQTKDADAARKKADEEKKRADDAFKATLSSDIKENRALSLFVSDVQAAATGGRRWMCQIIEADDERGASDYMNDLANHQENHTGSQSHWTITDYFVYSANKGQYIHCKKQNGRWGFVAYYAPCSRKAADSLMAKLNGSSTARIDVSGAANAYTTTRI